MDPLQCPRCESEFVRRSGRSGLLERLLSLAYVFPFRCELCDHRWKALRWGERYVRIRGERRAHDRIPVDFWTTLWWNQAESRGRVRDLSVGGCTLETDAALAPGEVLQLRLDPGLGEAGITVDVAVVRSVKTGRAGLQFVKVQGGNQERLRDVIHQLRKSGRG